MASLARVISKSRRTASRVARVAALALVAGAGLVGCGGKSAPAPRTATPEEMLRLYPQLVTLATPVRLSKAEPPPYCQPLGSINSAGGGGDPEQHYVLLQKRAAQRGGNYVVMDGMGGFLIGRAFRCPTAAVAATPAPASAEGACEPECSPGFTCLRGQCVSACNPACAGGSVCGADRVCRPAPFIH